MAVGFGLVRHMRHILLVVLTLLLAACGSLAVVSSFRISPDDSQTFMALRLGGTLEIPPQVVDGYTLGGLSGLAWDEDEQILYAVSDVGVLFHLRPLFAQGQLHDVELLAAYPLRDSWGQALARNDGNKDWNDAEDLAIRNAANGIRGDSELLVSFERIPRVTRQRPDGSWLGEEPLPNVLQNPNAYRGDNKMLEAVTWHPRWGLISTPEQPLRDEDALVLYAQQQSWQFAFAPALNSAVVALEARPDGSILILERAFTAPLLPLVISLRQFFPDTGALQTLAHFDSSQGWRLDNFEGLTAYGEHGIFMVSDNNFNGWQRTLLSYFEY